MRSKGAQNPKEAGPQAVHLYTADAGPDGPPLRSKYTCRNVYSFGTKRGGNSGNAGKKYRRKVRGGGYTTRSYSPAGRVTKQK